MNENLVVFNGIKYRRYPHYKFRTSQRYFTCSGSVAKRTGEYLLHRAIWKFHNGDIPEGFEIHHFDENTLNNDISNLRCIKRREHNILHKEKRQAAYNEWSKTDEAFQMHSRIAKNYWKNAKPQLKVNCTQCGTVFEKFNTGTKGGHFCSDNCYAIYRYRLTNKSLKKNCKYCGKEFVTHKFSKAVFCGFTCVNNNRWHPK